MNKLSKVEILMILAAISSLIISEVMWFQGNEKDALFVGLWVPSIIGFAIYLKLIKLDKNA